VQSIVKVRQAHKGSRSWARSELTLCPQQVVGSLNLATFATNGRFRGCAAAWLLVWAGRSKCCKSEGHDFNLAALEPDWTIAALEWSLCSGDAPMLR
jgi:hypothetical protein